MLNIILLFRFTVFYLFTSRWVFEKSPVWAITNTALLNVHICIFRWTCVLVSLIKTPRRGIAGSRGKFMFKKLPTSSSVAVSLHIPPATHDGSKFSPPYKM